MPFTKRDPKTARIVVTIADHELLELIQSRQAMAALDRLPTGPYRLTFLDAVTNDGLVPFLEADCPGDVEHFDAMRLFDLPPEVITFARIHALQVSETVKDLERRRVDNARLEVK